jgi:hypothetical protein
LYSCVASWNALQASFHSGLSRKERFTDFVIWGSGDSDTVSDDVPLDNGPFVPSKEFEEFVWDFEEEFSIWCFL